MADKINFQLRMEIPQGGFLALKKRLKVELKFRDLIILGTRRVTRCLFGARFANEPRRV